MGGHVILFIFLTKNVVVQSCVQRIHASCFVLFSHAIGMNMDEREESLGVDNLYFEEKNRFPAYFNKQ